MQVCTDGVEGLGVAREESDGEVAVDGVGEDAGYSCALGEGLVSVGCIWEWKRWSKQGERWRTCRVGTGAKNDC